MRRFLAAVQPQPGEKLLDIGGTAGFWAGSGISAALTLLNRDEVAAGSISATVQFVRGDGCALPFENRAFEIVFSNSVIEHVGTWARQQAFAGEARRCGQRLWVQTPAREFFLEPHLLTPFFHWLPRPWQRRLMRHFTLRGWIERPDPAAVDAFLEEVRLLTLTEMHALFPDCTILRERFLGMTKSYIAFRPAP